MKSETGHIGFIGGVENDLIKKFEAGYTAGAKQVNPDITVDVKYISQPPDFSGFNDPAKGKEIAAAMYEGGADIVYAAAGGSGLGMFQAAKEYSDANDTACVASASTPTRSSTVGADLEPYVMTSMLKRVDVAVYNTIADYLEGSAKVGTITVFDLRSTASPTRRPVATSRTSSAARGSEVADHRRHDHGPDSSLGSTEPDVVENGPMTEHVGGAAASSDGAPGASGPSPRSSCRGIVKRFPGVVANDGIDLAVAPRLDPRDRGRERGRQVDADEDPLRRAAAGRGHDHRRGVEQSFKSPRDAIAVGIGMVHQHFMLADNLTVEENVILGDEPGSPLPHRLREGVRPHHRARAGSTASTSTPRRWSATSASATASGSRS